METILSAPDVWFPNIGIKIENLDKLAVNGDNFFGLNIYWYGVIIAVGVLAGLFVAQREAVRTGQKKELYSDFLMYAVIFSIIGARGYYVLFKWNYFKDHLTEIFAIRNGGIAIYGAIIAGIVTAVIYTRIRKINFGKFLDTAVFGLIVGQIIGRWGNFINREAFGGYTDSFFALRYKIEDIKETSKDVLSSEHIKQFIIDGSDTVVSYVQVHPTFLYESFWNLCLFILLNIYKGRKKFDGEIVSMYFIGYGIGRFWIEGLRTDQLIIGNTGIAVSQLLSLLLAVVFFIYIIYRRKNIKNNIFLK